MTYMTVKQPEQVLKEIEDSLEPKRAKPIQLARVKGVVSPERLVRVVEKVLGYLDKVEKQNVKVLRLEGLSHKIAKDAEGKVKALQTRLNVQQRQIDQLRKAVEELASLRRLSEANENLAGRLIKR